MIILSKGHVIASGVVAKDAQLRFVGKNNAPVCTFGVKASEVMTGDVREAKWLNCVAWGSVAKYAAMIRKGDIVLVTGNMKDASYTNKEGKQVNKHECVVEGIVFMNGADMSNRESYNQDVAAGYQTGFSVEHDDDSDGDLPF